MVSKRMSDALDDVKRWILHVVRKSIPRHFDALTNSHRIHVLVQDVAKDAHAFVELDGCDRKGKPAVETGAGNADHGAGVDRPPARHLAPFQIPAAGEDAHRTRI